MGVLVAKCRRAENVVLFDTAKRVYWYYGGAGVRIHEVGYVAGWKTLLLNLVAVTALS